MRSPCVRGALFGILGGVALLATSGPAGAQTPGAIALDRFEPAPAGDPLFGVPSPFIGGHLVPRALVMFDHAAEPLTLAAGSTTTAVVASQSYVHVNASLALWDRLLVTALLPIAVAQGGESASLAGEPSPAASGAPAVGDLRLGARVRLFGEDGDPFQLGVGLQVHLPTGPSDAFIGEGAVRDTPQVMLGGRIGRFVWSAAGGAVIRSSENPSSLSYGGGVAVLLLDERLQVGPEVYAQTPLQTGSIQVTERTRLATSLSTGAEALLGARYRLFDGALDGLTVGAAGGPGLGDALGTPVFRLVGSVGWAPPARPRVVEVPADIDEDGIPNEGDACPYAHGVKSADPARHGCPVVDRDEDGVADEDDACPDVAGEAASRGCPADSDGDGVIDAEDACPQEAGEVSDDPAKRGCPAVKAPPPVDSDGDGLLDTEDACPHEKGPASDDASTSGCPKRVRVVGDEVVTLEPVAFRVSRTDPAPLDPRSEPVLAELRDVIAQHPEWVKIEVQAHTDSTGNAKYNEALSAARAESVRKWLAANGVDAGRLSAKGYGGSQPKGDNATAAGREKNRRVQLLVLEKK